MAGGWKGNCRLGNKWQPTTAGSHGTGIMQLRIQRSLSVESVLVMEYMRNVISNHTFCRICRQQNQLISIVFLCLAVLLLLMKISPVSTLSSLCFIKSDQ